MKRHATHVPVGAVRLRTACGVEIQRVAATTSIREQVTCRVCLAVILRWPGDRWARDGWHYTRTPRAVRA